MLIYHTVEKNTLPYSPIESSARPVELPAEENRLNEMLCHNLPSRRHAKVAIPCGLAVRKFVEYAKRSSV